MAAMKEARSGMLSRAEAFPLPWDDLTDDQQRVVKSVAQLFGELAEQGWEAPRKQGVFDRFLLRLDAERRNHVALIEGERGIGKTAVLLTLLRAWGAIERAEGPDLCVGAPPEGVVRGRVVPVGLVDLQPLPPGTNLLVHLAGQLSRLVDAIDDIGTAPSPRQDAWNPNRPAEAASRTQWRAFVQAAAAGWDGRLDTRRASLDPEAFALEFEEAERHRLDVRERFRDLVDALVQEYPKVFQQRRGTPFFVIPIDDADMNPGRVREVLDLLRALWHPRVGFLVTGHNELFVEVLKDHLAGGKDRTSTQQDGLAKAIYDKAIPPYQRFGLRVLPFAERMRLVGETLRQTRAFEHPLKPSHLLDYLEVNRLAGLMLPKNIRELRDWETLIVRRHFDLGLERLRSYRLPDRDEHIGSLLARLSGPDASDIEIAGDIGIGGGPDYGDRLLGFSAEMMLAQDAQRQPIEEQTRIPLGRTVVDSVNIHWPTPRWASWLDHAAFAYLLRVVFQIVTDESVDWLGAEYRWYYAHSASSFSRDEALRAFLTWTLRYLDFRRDRASNPRGTLREALDDLLSREGSAKVSMRGAVIFGWEQISDGLDNLTNDATRPAEERRWASVSAALFAAPEHRLGPEVANTFLMRVKNRHLSADWRDVTAMLRDLRAKHTVKNRTRYDGEKNKNDPDPPAVLQQIDAKSSRYDWVFEISRREGVQDDLLDLLAGFSNAALSGGKPMTLSAYFDSERWLTVQRHLSDDLRGRWMERLSRLPKGGVSAPLAALVMWNEAVRAGAAPKLSPLQGEPGPAKLQEMYELLGLHPWGFQPGGSPVDLGALRLESANLAWTSSTGLDDTLDGVLFEVLWDVVMDAPTREKTGHGLLRWWAPAGMLDKDLGRTLPWPFPAWSTFLDVRLFAISYNEQVRRIRAALPSLPSNYDISASMAHFYISAVLSLLHQRRVTVEWEARPAVFLWQNLLGAKHQLPGNGAREAAVRECLQRMPLLAAPESGLSPDTAKDILEACNASPEERDILRRVRRERLRDMGISDDAQITAHLARIDAEHEGHPWPHLLGAVMGP